MESFNQTVGTGAVGSGSGMADAEEPHEKFPKMGLKLSSSVKSEEGWNTETRDPAGQECLGNRFCAGVSEWDDFWPTGEAIHAGE